MNGITVFNPRTWMKIVNSGYTRISTRFGNGMHDLILRGGRVMDPETGYDAVSDVALADGHIAAIGPNVGDARRVFDVTGLVVAPGFIDLHAHGQSLPADRMQAFDGVTTSLELELGVMPVARWYDEQAHAGRTLNYGASVGWVLPVLAP